MIAKTFGRNISEPYLNLETHLEKKIAMNPEWLTGVEWGRPRPGHPEGKVIFHIRDVLHNIDSFLGDSSDRSSLRLIALLHDTFKYKVVCAEPGARKLSHCYLARKFAEGYINDLSILEVIELHDEAYKASLLMTRHGNRGATDKYARELITRLSNNVDLFMRFYLCDSQTYGKSTAHYEWFKGLVKK